MIACADEPKFRKGHIVGFLAGDLLGRSGVVIEYVPAFSRYIVAVDGLPGTFGAREEEMALLVDVDLEVVE